jgi:hypothetical protein
MPLEIPKIRWSTVGGHLSRFMQSNIRAVRTVEFGLAVGCIWAAWTAGGDMWLVVPALLVGFIFAVIGIASVPDLTRRSRTIWGGLVAAIYIAIGLFLYWHFQPKSEPPQQRNCPVLC